MPSEFLWQGLDGTRIPAFWLPFSYGYLYGPPTRFAAFHRFHEASTGTAWPLSREAATASGLAGVDVSEPELYVPGLVEQFNRQPNLPFTLRIGVPTDFEAIRRQAKRPARNHRRAQSAVSGNLQQPHRTQAADARDAERLLTTVEKFGVLANWLGTPVDNQ